MLGLPPMGTRYEASVPTRPDFRLPRELLGRLRFSLAKLYSSILSQPLPPELERLVDMLKRRMRE